MLQWATNFRRQLKTFVPVCPWTPGYTRWPKKVVRFSTHHIFGTFQDKMKQISPKCS